jgi:hypothetical protein
MLSPFRACAAVFVVRPAAPDLYDRHTRIRLPIALPYEAGPILPALPRREYPEPAKKPSAS